MVYECEDCEGILLPGITTCPKCGTIFDEAVPQDAESPKRGWQPKMEAGSFSQPASEPISSAGNPESVAESHKRHHPDRVYWRSKAQQVKKAIGTAASSQYGQKLKQKPILVGLGLLIFAFVLVILIRPHTNSYVFEQHPLYQANVAELFHPSSESSFNQMPAEFVWPYEDHENRLKCILHSNGSSGIGSDPSAPLNKGELDLEAAQIRALFCTTRYRSGFTLDEAMQCQVYVYFNDASDTGYDGPGVAPERDAAVEHLLELEQVQ